MTWLSKIVKLSKSGTMIMYHATVAGAKILNEGFKTRKQLNDKSALGGGVDDAISFTTDWHVAKGIFDAFVFAWKIANSNDPLLTIKTHFNSLDDSIQQSVKKMYEVMQGKYMEMNFSGWTLDGVFNWLAKHEKPKTEQELLQLGFKPYSKDGHEPVVHDNLYYNWMRPLTEREKNDILYSYLKAYYSGDPSVYNPVFFGSDIQHFQGVSRDDIGIITAEVEIDPTKRNMDDFYQNENTHRYVGSMAEVRIKDLSIIKRILNYDNNPESPPNYQSESYYYGEDEKLETAINNLLSFIYTNYTDLKNFFLPRKVEIDQVISNIQHYGHDKYKFAQVVSAINKLTGIDNISYLLPEYLKYKQRIDIPPDIQKLLLLIPSPWRERLMSGDRARDVFSDMYDQNQAMYEQWWTSHQDTYDAEKLIDDWSWNRKDDLGYFERYAKPTEDILQKQFPGENLELIMRLSQILRQSVANL